MDQSFTIKAFASDPAGRWGLLITVYGDGDVKMKWKVNVIINIYIDLNVD